MKILLIGCLSLLLPLMAQANGPAPDKVPPGAEVKTTMPAAEHAAAAAPAKQPRAQLHRHYPRGDLRHCLGQKSNDAVIRCAERRRK